MNIDIISVKSYGIDLEITLTSRLHVATFNIFETIINILVK